jgi:hypothetical protein
MKVEDMQGAAKFLQSVTIFRTVKARTRVCAMPRLPRAGARARVGP